MSESFEGMEPGEISYVIELLAAMCSEDEIKKKFFEFTFPGKAITGKQIQRISLRFAKQIRERNEAYLRNIKGNPLAHMRVRLDILNRIVEDSLKERPSHSVKTSTDEYEIVTKRDNPTAINAIKLAIFDLTKREELDMKQKELEEGKEDEDDGEIDIDDGLTAS